jgi:hypothetical protein
MNFVIPTLAISIMYVLFKIIDTKYISKDDIPVKSITKDGFIVFLCGSIILLAFEQLDFNNMIGGSSAALSAFTNSPDF